MHKNPCTYQPNSFQFFSIDKLWRIDADSEDYIQSVTPKHEEILLVRLLMDATGDLPEAYFQLKVSGGGTHEVVLDFAEILGHPVDGMTDKKLILKVCNELIDFPANRLHTPWVAPKDLLAQGYCDVIQNNQLLTMTSHDTASLACHLNKFGAHCSIRFVTMYFMFFFLSPSYTMCINK